MTTPTHADLETTSALQREMLLYLFSKFPPYNPNWTDYEKTSWWEMLPKIMAYAFSLKGKR